MLAPKTALSAGHTVPSRSLLRLPSFLDDDDDDDVELNVLGCRVDILMTNCDQCVSMVKCCFTSTETLRLVRTESPGRPPRL